MTDANLDRRTNDTSVARLTWRMDDIERRLQRIEELRPEILAERLDRLNDSLDSWRKIIITAVVSLVGSSLLFAFTTFALLGR